MNNALSLGRRRGAEVVVRGEACKLQWNKAPWGRPDFLGIADVICSTIAAGFNPPPPPSPLAVEVNQLEGCCQSYWRCRNRYRIFSHKRIARSPRNSAPCAEDESGAGS
jgi:hypothetical protein